MILELALAVWLIGAMTGEGIAFAGAGLTLAALIHQKQKPAWPALGLWVAFTAYQLLSALWAERPLRSGAPWSAIHWGFFPLALWAVPLVKERTRLVRLFIGLALLSAALATFQHYVYMPELPFVKVWRTWDPAPFGGYMGGGLHFHRLRYAHTLVPMLAAFLPLMAWRWRIIVFAASVVGLWFTYTRASWIALLAMCIAFATSRWRWTRWAWPLLLLVPAVDEERLISHVMARNLFMQHPWFGVGYGGYTTATHSALLLHLDAHSLFWQQMAELGLVGTALWLACAFFVIRRTHVPALAAMCVLGMVHNWAFHPVVVAAAAFGMAFAISSENEVRDVGKSAERAGAGTT